MAYLGKVRDKRTQTVRTESVLASETNGWGKNPVWSTTSCKSINGRLNNVLYITPSSGDVHLTVEVWDSDIGQDDLLGGRTLMLDELRQRLVDLSGSATTHIQLFDQDGNQGFERGHDAGVLQVHASYERQSAGGERVVDATRTSIRIEVQAAVDLLPDTPAIRDLTTFADWKNTTQLGIGLGVYMFAFAAYFGWFFAEYTCSSAGNIACANVTGVKEYPAEAGNPLIDAVLFMLGSVTTVGWGSQPVNFVRTPDELSDSGFWFSLTKVILSLQVLIGIVLIGLLIGSLGESFRTWFRKHNALLYGGLAQTPLLETPPVGEKPELGKVQNGLCGSLEAVHIAMMLLCTVVLIGAVGFAFLDDIALIDAWYLTIVTVSTVGYGDLSPTSFSSKLFACFYVPLGVAFVANAIDTVSVRILAKRGAELERFVLGQFGERDSLDNNDLSSFDFEELQRATQVEYGAPLSLNDFRLAMLLRLGRVDHEDMEMIDKVFADLDRNRTGFITQKDVVGDQDCAMTRRIERLQGAWANEAGSARLSSEGIVSDMI